MRNPIKTVRMQTQKTWQELEHELATVFALWEIDRGEYGVTKLNPGAGVKVWYYLSFDPDRKEVTSAWQDRSDENLWVCVDALTAMQRAAKRGVSIFSAGVELIALPPGDPNAVPPGGASEGPTGRRTRAAADGKSRFRTLRQASQALGVDVDATSEDVEDMSRLKARRYHTDNQETGDLERFKEVQEAAEFIKRRQGWV